MKKITIKEVAKEAGVSISTVSNALNDSDLVTMETKKRVKETAERLNYIPNISGRMLKCGKSNMIGFFTSDVGGFYFSTLIDAIYQECERIGYGLNIVAARDKKIVMNQILGGNLEGLIVFQAQNIGEKELFQLKNSQTKAIFLDRMIKDQSIGSVLFDSFQASYRLTNHLIELKHKIIYFIEGEPSYDSIERKRGYLKAMADSRLTVIPEYILSGMFNETHTYQAVLSLIQKRKPLPDAFIAGNDISAIGCINALLEYNYHVPDNISVVGFDDIEIAKYFKPSITTIRNPIIKQGQLAVQRLSEMINQETSGRIDQLEGKLVIRDSQKRCEK